MVVVILRIKAASMNRAEIVNLIQPIIGPTEAQPGCLLCRLNSETNDDDALLLLQEWRSQKELNEFIRLADRHPVFRSSVCQRQDGCLGRPLFEGEARLVEGSNPKARRLKEHVIVQSM